MAPHDAQMHEHELEPPQPPAIVFLPIEEVERRISLSRRTIYNMVDSGDFPKPVNISARRIAFVEGEVTTWQQDLMDARDPGEGGDD